MSSHFITHLLAQRSLAISMQSDQILARASLLVYPERYVVVQKYKKNVTYKRQERLKTKKENKNHCIQWCVRLLECGLSSYIDVLFSLYGEGRCGLKRKYHL